MKQAWLPPQSNLTGFGGPSINYNHIIVIQCSDASEVDQKSNQIIELLCHN